MSFERKLAAAGVTLVSGLVIGLATGCGAGYRPVVTPTSPAGPASQPQSLVAVISSPSTSSPGVANVIDYSGDTIMAEATLGPNPLAFTLDETGSNGYTLNSDGTITNFPVSTTLQQKNITYSSLTSESNPVGFFSPSANFYAADLNGNAVDVFQSIPAVFKLTIPVDPTPIMVIGSSVVGQRDYAITQGAVSSPTACNTAPTSGPAGKADGIEVSSDTVSSSLQLGKCPVFAVQSPDGRRLFVLNRGDDTITVINSQLNTLDQCTPFKNQAGQLVTCHPTLPLSTAGVTASGVQPVNPSTANLQAIAGPVYAEYNTATSQLVIADFDGGTISIIDVSEDIYGNDANSYDANGNITGGFGTTYTVKVGNGSTPNPASVTVLYDGSRAYTANQNDDSTGNGTGNGTVSIVNIASHTLEKTLAVNGHPRTVVSTQNSEQGKVYVASPDSPYLTILRTDQDIVDTTVLVQGNVVDVRVSTQNGNSGNALNVSRIPGYGQPCNLSAQQLGTGSLSLDQCRAQTLQ